ncbi:hypothetical protein JCM19240_909 [Vibrio maritimus]|uniref:Uncharacterized protein n=1 Tax=Vibrio maritimus TaxID=990268 RepID=A0A090T244_9VIBR|nr:hypothetical protein JCM19240_909 [Vibrio maritimus]
MLSDDTVMIPLENLCRRVSESLSGNEKVVFNGVDRIEADYCFNITSRYLFVYPKQLLSAPKSELCHLTLAFNHSSSEASVKFAICLDLSRFSTLSTARLSLPFDTTSFEQKMLTQLTPSLSSPIAFVESVFCLDCHQFLTPRSDGSFIDRQSRATTAKSRSFIYSICDGVDHVATGIAVANLPSQSLEASNRRQTNAEY